MAVMWHIVIAIWLKGAVIIYTLPTVYDEEACWEKAVAYSEQ